MCAVLKVLDAVCDMLNAQGELIVLIKPQFEAGKAQVSAGGVVRDPAVHQVRVCCVSSKSCLNSAIFNNNLSIHVDNSFAGSYKQSG